MLEAASCTATPRNLCNTAAPSYYRFLIWQMQTQKRTNTAVYVSPYDHKSAGNAVMIHVNFTWSSQREKAQSGAFRTGALSNGMCRARQDGGIKLCSKCFESYRRGCGGKERGGQRVGACEARLPTPTAHTSRFPSPAPPGRARCRLMSVQPVLEVFL